MKCRLIKRVDTTTNTVTTTTYTCDKCYDTLGYILVADGSCQQCPQYCKACKKDDSDTTNRKTICTDCPKSN